MPKCSLVPQCYHPSGECQFRIHATLASCTGLKRSFLCGMISQTSSESPNMDDQDRPAFIVAGLFPCRQERLLSREDAWKVALKSKTLYNGRFCASDERVNTSNNTKGSRTHARHARKPSSPGMQKYWEKNSMCTYINIIQDR
nr:uncharacterized protein LOC112937926 isoform X2 [Oryza sativa Japonica Group]